MRSLYITWTGMADNLGQSQVLPYLKGLARRGVEFDVISYELATITEEAREDVDAFMKRFGIRWHPLTRKMPGTLPVKFAESALGVTRAAVTALSRQPDIIHGRSYLGTAVCDVVGEVARRSKLLFDCRGMLGDEYVDGGYWKADGIEYRLVKGYERRIFARFDGIVVLTRALRTWLRENEVVSAAPAMEVVPCCVDLERFHPHVDARARLRRELDLGDDLTLIYSGSLGNWYLEPEMARFAADVQALAGDVRFVILSPSDTKNLKAELERVGFPPGRIVERRVQPKHMAEYLSVGDIGLSFIKSCFSKMGSSPTKVAEYLACGNVAVVNGDIGDQLDLASEAKSCVVLNGFSDAEITRAAREAVALARRPRDQRTTDAIETARRHFGLEEVGVTRYMKLYEDIAARGRLR